MISSISTKKGKPSVLPYDMAKRWGIGLETAKKALLHTTQRGLRTALTHICPRGIGQMIRCSDTSDCQPTFLLIQCELGSSHIVGTLVHKFMLTGTRGVRRIL